MHCRIEGDVRAKDLAEFRESMAALTGFCPLTKSATIVCTLVYCSLCVHAS